MRKFVLVSLFALTLAAGLLAISPGYMSTAYAYPPNPCGEI